MSRGEQHSSVSFSICSVCSKRYIVVKADSDNVSAYHCSCGGVLARVALEPGVYEIGSAVSPHGQQKADSRRPPRKEPHSTIPREADLGYNESHGYGPAHGGPTGPGDAPAVDIPADATDNPSAGG